MSILGPPDTHYLSAAQGWLELGNPTEASQELACISPPNAGQPDVLEVRWTLLAHQKQWEAALEQARQLIQADPDRCTGWIDQSYTLHELKRTEEARRALLSVATRFPNVMILPYNLACYACQLGDLPDAREWLAKAIALSGREEIRKMALADLDLQPLWPEIKRGKR